MAKGGSGDVLSGITAGILAQFKQMEYNDDQMLSELEADPDIELSPTSIFRWISVNDSEAAKIKSLRAEYWKTRDIHLLSELRRIMDEKLKQTITLLASLYVAKAVYIHGLAGDIAAATFGQQSMIATDIIKSLGEAFAVCQQEAMSKFSYIQR
jgi:NAD(P)H-hydrate repair Nnr-like enzyme with NAD(P)H-hydrate dehydratase domain